MDLADVPWTLAPGWSPQRVLPPVDIDADGDSDLVLDVLGDDGARWSLVLLGPLGRPRELPNGADLSILGHVNGIGDFTGDGALDLQVMEPPVADAHVRSAVRPGPVRAGTAPETLPFRKGQVGGDYDGDGRPDYVEIAFGVRFARIWTGLEPTWGVAQPTMTLTDPAHPTPEGVTLPYPLDSDGDRIRELWWQTVLSGPGQEVHAYEGPLRGSIDLVSAPRQPAVIWSVGDVDGDGVVDWREGNDGPIVAGPYPRHAGVARRELRGRGLYRGALGLDLDGDGIGELIESDRRAGTYTLAPGGPVPKDTRWTPPGVVAAAWVEDGIGRVIVPTDGGYVVRSLGPATAVPTAP